MTEWLEYLNNFLNLPIYQNEKSVIRLLDILEIVVFFGVVLVGSWAVQRWVIVKLLKRTPLGVGTQYVISRLSGYLITILGCLIVIQSVGVDLGPLTIFAGALGVGVGFGMQNVVNNFISGIILLVERPIKVGDYVDHGQSSQVRGRVVSISLRSTSILTNDNINIIVPNSELVSQRVINWSHNNRKVRFRVPIGVDYATDEDLLVEGLLEVANANDAVLQTPGPEVFLKGFGDSSIDFELVVWTEKLSASPEKFISGLNFGIRKKLKELDITIPFPQRDVHLKPVAGQEGILRISNDVSDA